MLLKAGANPNMQLKLFPPYRSLRDDRGADSMLTVGTTPLLRAAQGGGHPGDETAARTRRQRRAARRSTASRRCWRRAGNGSSALDTRGRYKTEAQAVEAVKLLLAAGASIKASDRQGQTALHGAAGWGWNSLIETAGCERRRSASRRTRAAARRPI